jgi:DNA-binding transcriptional MerR regulator
LKGFKGGFSLKIGKFAKQFDLTIDTVRYYIEIGLLTPEKIHNQYTFDDRCEKDLEEILELKSMRFTVSQIQKIFSIKRFTNLTNQDGLDYYVSFFDNKKHELLNEKDLITKAIKDINEKIISIRKNFNDNYTKIGVPLFFINFLYCPECDSKLNLSKGSIEDNQVFKGELSCKCGYKANIDNGIIITDSADYNKPEIEEVEKPGENYVKKSNQSFVNLVYKGMDWIYKRFNKFDLSNKFILELGTGSGFFLKKIIGNIPESSFYIACDDKYEVIKSSKNYMESMGKTGNIIFVSSKFSKIPIKKGIIDIILDVYGSSSRNLKNDVSPIQGTKNFLKINGYWLGSYLYFKESSKTLKKLDSKIKDKFLLENIKASFNINNLKEIESYYLGNSKKTGYTEPFIIDGDTVNHWAFYGIKY